MTTAASHRQRATAVAVDDPLRMLADCHCQIDAQLARLENLAARLPSSGADNQARSEALDIIRFFDGEAEHHRRDEDEDLFPLLRKLALSADRPEVGATLYELEREHRHMAILYGNLREQLCRISEHHAHDLAADPVAHFAWLHRRHMRLEASVVDSFAAEALDPAERAAFAARMAARRSA